MAITIKISPNLTSVKHGWSLQYFMEDSITITRYDYVSLVLEDDFLPQYLEFSRAGILPYEVLNMCTECSALPDIFDFERNEDSRLLRYAVITAIDDYLKEGVIDGL